MIHQKLFSFAARPEGRFVLQRMLINYCEMISRTVPMIQFVLSHKGSNKCCSNPNFSGFLFWALPVLSEEVLFPDHCQTDPLKSPIPS